MANETCRTCKFVRPIDDIKGKCKVCPPCRSMSGNAMMNETKIVNGWPVVQLDDTACGEWKIIN